MAQRTQRLIEAARRPMPEGTFVVGAGLLVAGLSAYGFQILSFRALSEANYNALNGLWVFVFVLAPGFFLPLEQEVGRALADRRVKQIGGRPIVERATIAGLVLTISLALLTIAAAVGTPLVEDLFDGNTGLAVCLVIALFTYGVQHLARGTLSGSARFGSYGLIIGAEGVIRLVPCAILAIAGVTNPAWYGLCLALPPAFAAALALSRERGHHLLEPGPYAPWSELTANLGFLFFASISAQVLSYAPFLAAVLVRTPSQDKMVATFLAGVFLARIPILLFQAVQAALLPKLAGLAGAGMHNEFRTALRKLVVVIIGIGTIGVLAALALGPEVGEILFGNKFNLGREDLALLALGSGIFILALTLAQALIALMGHWRVLVAWVTGIAAFVAVFVTSDTSQFDPEAAEVAFIVGAFASAVTMAMMLLWRMRADFSDEDALMRLAEQIEHEPLEI